MPSHDDTRNLAKAIRRAEEARTVESTGYLIVTTVTDNIGRETFQHSQIYRTREQAEKIAAVSRPLKVWERKIERTVRECRTRFPIATASRDTAEAPAMGERKQAA